MNYYKIVATHRGFQLAFGVSVESPEELSEGRHNRARGPIFFLPTVYAVDAIDISELVQKALFLLRRSSFAVEETSDHLRNDLGFGPRHSLVGPLELEDA